jgi:hypothetical protein
MKRIAGVIIGVIVLNLVYVTIFNANGVSAEDHSHKEAAALKTASSWLALVDAGNYSKSWDEAAAYFKNALTKEQWQQSLNAARKPLGKLLRRKVLSKAYATALPGAPDGEYVVIQYNTIFEHKKSATETVTPMKDKDGQWRVSGYYVK